MQTLATAVKLFLALLLVMLTPGMHAASPREAAWKKVEEAVQQGLPQTALAALEPILREALAERAWPEAVKALCRKIVLEAEIQGGAPEERITRLEAALAGAPAEIRPLLETILAHWYWQYFQQNRWRFLQRSATAEPPGPDFRTWDLRRLFAEIDRHFTAAFADADRLRRTPVTAFDEFLVRGTLPDTYRPTLYDFLAHEALKFYTAGEQVGARPEDAFEIRAEDPIFDSVDLFLAWQPATADTNAPALKAIRLYQELLRFHRDDADRTAFLDVDLARLLWGGTAAGEEGRAERLKAALQRFVESAAGHELEALSLSHWARLEREAGNPAEAHRLATRGRAAHPDSPGGKLCANLIAEIEAKSAHLSTERVWNAPWPTLTVRYRNVTQVWFRAVAWDWDEFLQREHNRPENLSEEERRAVLAKAPVLAWSAPLPPTTDFKERTVELPAPTTLAPGFYFLIASHKPDFSEADNQLSLTTVWVSDLALVTRTRAGQLEGFVLEAASGEPIASARVHGWYLDPRGNRVAVPEVFTDTNGFFTVNAPRGRGVLLKATARGQSLATGSEWQVWEPPRRERAQEQTFLFTDRAIYRPGQIIQYKGICLRADRANDRYEALARESVTVAFYDVNGQEIARQRHAVNDYGAFSGSFTAPRGRLTGPMRLQVVEGPAGLAHVTVEEYKRPKFQVTLEPPTGAARLGAEVLLPGRAVAYTGAAIDRAEVRYRVVRRTRMPWWWFGWRPPPLRGAEQEIAHGQLQTDAEGRFQIRFPARPDPKVPPADEPVFEFEVQADVTDNAGETRSDTRVVRLGYAALEARLAAPEWLVEAQPVRLEARVTSLDGDPQVTAGVLRVHALQAPDTVQRPKLHEPVGPRFFRGLAAPDEAGDREGVGEPPDLSDPAHWPPGAVVAEQAFTTDTNGVAVVEFRLPAGAYRAVLETRDPFGRVVTARLPLTVLNPDAERFPVKVPQHLAARAWEVQPGEDFLAVWGTGYETGRAFVEIEHRGRFLQRYWTRPGVTQAQIQQAVGEAHRGGFNLLVTFVRENRAHLITRQVQVPWKNKELALRWVHFRSKLEPGQRETWTLEVRRPKSEGAESEGAGAERWAAELVATLYDASLDAFAPLSWPGGFGVFRQEPLLVNAGFANVLNPLQPFTHWTWKPVPVELRYRDFPPEIRQEFFAVPPMALRYGLAVRGIGPQVDMLAMPAATLAEEGAVAANMAQGRDAQTKAAGAPPGLGGASETPSRGPDLSRVSARRNLNETAFFFPHLRSDSNGLVHLEFTMPEALTEWRFLGFAHDRALHAGLLEGRTVTARDLMVQPNPPRFVREGDVLEFTVKVSNQSDRPQRGTVRLTFTDGLTDRPADAALGNAQPEQAFELAPRQSRGFAWRITVPDGLTVLAFKAVGATETVSDGEEGFVPVLARRVLVTESLPLPIRGPAERQFHFRALAESAASPTLRHQSLTVQMVSQPAWYAVLALPYLMEFPHECAEQVFNRYYANALARFIANSDPKIRRIFDLWKNTPALDSPLEKNAELKAVVLEESPWVRQAQRESEARRNVGVLFDANRLETELARALDKLREAARPDGGWAWFPGGPRDEYITRYIVAGFGRLRHLGVNPPVDLALRALEELDRRVVEQHAHILKDWKQPEDYVPGPADALYLYGRSFFLKDRPLAEPTQRAVDFFLARARQHWLKTARQTQGHLALALQRFGDSATAQAIARSLKERSVTSEELGRYWRDAERSWWWYHAPIETQALMIEVFAEVTRDAEAVEECQVWLLKQKQTQNWPSTKATADAVYALLLRGRNLLGSDALVEVSLGGRNVTPAASPSPETRDPRPEIEPGTGFYEVRFAGPEVRPELAAITVRKTDPGVAWGSVHWQYFEDLSLVKPYEGTPLQLKKALFVKRHTTAGSVLEPVSGPVAVGDELVVRLELRVDRDMEYVHLKDARGSGVEPVNVLSGYRSQDGLGYYESTRDAASHFFIGWLPRGTYVFEYSGRVQLRGEYQTGPASIQCLYAPEFNSHSESFKLVVR